MLCKYCLLLLSRSTFPAVLLRLFGRYRVRWNSREFLRKIFLDTVNQPVKRFQLLLHLVLLLVRHAAGQHVADFLEGINTRRQQN